MNTVLKMTRETFAPILRLRSDLAFERRVLVVRPIDHYFIGCLFDARSAIRVRVRWNVWQIYATSSPGMLASFSDHLPYEFAYHDFTGNADLDAKWRDAVIAQIDSLSWIRDHDTFLEFMDSRYPKLFPSYRVLAEAVRGNLGIAECFFRDQVQQMHKHNSMPRAIEETTMLHDAIAAGPEKFAAFLHAREAAAIKYEKLEKYWQPTPFPFELAGKT
jgi:hypothetical protein